MKREIIDRDTNIKLKFTADNQDVKTSINQLLAGLKEIQKQAGNEKQISLGKGIKEFRKEITQSLPISKDLQDSIARIQEYIQEAFGTDAVNKFNTMLLGTNSTISQTVTLADRLSNADLSKVFSTMFNVGAMMAAYHGIKRVASSLTELSKESINFVETKNLFDVSMGNGVEALSQYYDRAIKFQNELGEKLSINTQDSMNYQALFNAMSKSMGIAAGEAYKLSENFTKLGYDIASLYNLDPTAAMDKLRAGLAGQTKPLRDIGLDITQQSLTPIAQELGIDRSVKNMSQAEKMILRYIAVLRQASLAQGDFAKTMETPANQMRIFNSQITILKRNVGNLWSGMLSRILPYVNAVIMVINELLKMLGAFFGFSVSSFSGVSISDAIGADDAAADLGGATAAAKEFKKQLMGFDEIHNIELPDTSSGGGGGGGGGGNISGIDQRLLDAMKDYDNMMENVRNKATDIRDKIMDWLGFTKIINPETGEITWQLRDGLQNIEKILDVVKTIGVAFAAWKVSSSIMKVISTLGWVGKEKALSVAANLTLAITGIFAQYQGTKHLLDGDVDVFSLLETLLGNAAGTFGIAKLLNTVGGIAMGKSIGIGLGIMLSIQGIQVVADGIKKDDIIKQIIGSIELGLGVGIVAAAAGASLEVAVPVGLVVTGVTFGIAAIASSDVEEIQNAIRRVSETLKQAYNDAKNLAEITRIMISKEPSVEAKKLAEEVQNLTSKVKDLKKATDDKITSAEASAISSEKEMTALEKMIDTNGRVKEGYEERVKLILTDLNNALGTELSMNDNIISKDGEVVGSYEELRKKIQEVIDIKLEDARKSAYLDGYKESIKEQVQAEKDYKEVLEKRYLAEERIRQLTQEKTRLTTEETKELVQLRNDVESYDKTLSELSGTYEDAGNSAVYYAEQVGMSTDDINLNIENSSLMTKKSLEDIQKQWSISAEGTKTDTENMTVSIRDFMKLTTGEVKKGTEEQNTAWKNMTKEAKENYIDYMVGGLTEETKNSLKGVMDTLQEMTPQEVMYWAKMSKQNHEEYEKEVSQLPTNTQEALRNVVKEIEGNEDDFYNATSDNAQAMADAIDDKAPVVNQSVQGVVGIAAKSANKLGGELDTAGSNGGSGLASGISSQQWNVQNAASGLGNAASDEITNRNWNWVGEQIPSGVANGINSGKSSWSFGDAISSLASTLKSRLQRALGIASPSKVMRDEVGKWIPAGIAEGIDENSKVAYNSLENLSNGMENATKNLTSGIGEELQNININPEDYKLRTETDINQIVETKVTIDSNLPELFYNAIVNGMNDSSVQVNVQARTDKGVIFEVVQEEANNFYNSTGEAPFPVV